MKTYFKKNHGPLKQIVLLSAALWFSVSLHADDNEDAPAQSSSCSAHVERLEKIQNSIYDYKLDPEDSKYIDLLKERDRIMAKKSFIESMIKVWDEYNSYLDESNEFNNKYGDADLKLTQKLEGLSTLKDVISGNREAVQRYNLMASVFNDIDVSKINATDKVERFDQMRDLLKEQCTGENAQANRNRMYCKAVGPNDAAWDTMVYGGAPEDTGSSQRDMIYKFIQVSVTAFGTEFMGVFRNMSTMFVDNDHLNADLVNDIDYASGVDLGTSINTTIDEAIALCRRQGLAETSGDVDCLKRDLSEVLAENGKGVYLEKIQTTLGPEVKSASDLLNKFLENAGALKAAHEEFTGGVISDFAKLVENKDKYVSDMDSFGEEAKANREAAQEEFKSRIGVHIASLGQNLKQLSNNDTVYKDSGRLDTEKIDSSSCTNRASAMLCSAASSFGAALDEDSRNELYSLFGNTTDDAETAGSTKLFSKDPLKLLDFLNKHDLNKEKLSDILKGTSGSEDSIEAQLQAVEAKIAALKNNDTYKTLEDIKAFVWRRAEEECSGVAAIVNNTSCASSDNFSEVDRLFRFGGKIAAYQSNERERYNLADIEKKCDSVRQNNQSENFEFDIIGICNEVSKSYSNLVAYENYFSPDEVDKRLRTRKSYDLDGNVTGSYTEKSFMALFLPALSRQAVTVMPTWANKYKVKSYALQQTILGKRQKDYNSYIDMLQSSAAASCSGLFGCSSLWSYQSYYPSYSSYSSYSSGLSSFSGSSTGLFSN